MSLEIIMYHYVRPISESAYPKIKGLEVKRFIKQIDYLQKNKKIVSTEDVIKSVNKKKDLPEGSVWLTFDDGYKDHIEFVAPILEKKGIDACFFPVSEAYNSKRLLDVNKIHYILALAKSDNALIKILKEKMLLAGYTKKDFLNLWNSVDKSSRYDSKNVMFFKKILQKYLPLVIRSKILDEIFEIIVGKKQTEISKELYMSKSDLRYLYKKGFTIGTHTSSHRWLDRLTYDEQKKEIAESIRSLKKITGNKSGFIMCYPYGGYNKNTLKILKKYNCTLALTTRPGIANLSKDHKYELPRLDTNDFPQ
jgi:peptidoglycan/xylan/chitin deacetylase (PgdA/CDA1 family)